jgi:hypothetical protein
MPDGLRGGVSSTPLLNNSLTDRLAVGFQKPLMRRLVIGVKPAPNWSLTRIRLEHPGLPKLFINSYSALFNSSIRKYFPHPKHESATICHLPSAKLKLQV